MLCICFANIGNVQQLKLPKPCVYTRLSQNFLVLHLYLRGSEIGYPINFMVSFLFPSIVSLMKCVLPCVTMYSLYSQTFSDAPTQFSKRSLLRWKDWQRLASPRKWPHRCDGHAPVTDQKFHEVKMGQEVGDQPKLVSLCQFCFFFCI